MSAKPDIRALLAAALATSSERIESLALLVGDHERELREKDASLASAQQRIEELERALGELVAPSQLYEAIAAEFSDDGVPWSRVRGDLRSVYRGYAKIINAWNRHAARAIGTREGGDANAAPRRSPESAVATATRPSEAFLRGISPQATWPFAQDDKGTK